MKRVGFASLVLLSTLPLVSVQGETDSVLEEFDKSFREEFARRVENPRKSSLKELEENYLGALERALDLAASEGRLEDAIAIKGEKERIGKGDELPDVDSAEVPEKLQQLRLKLQEEVARIEAEALFRHKVLVDEFVPVLERQKLKLTQEKNLEAALKVAARLKEVRAGVQSNESEDAQPMSMAVGSEPEAEDAAAEPKVGFFQSLDEIIAAIPEETLRKMARDSSRSEGIIEANSFLRSEIMNSRMEFEAEPVLVDDRRGLGKKFRLKLPSELKERNKGEITESMFWAYFSDLNSIDYSGIEVNQEVKIGGRIDRCDIVDTNGVARLAVDLQEAEIIP